MAKKYNVPADIFLFELNLDVIKSEFQDNNLALYQPYSTYPKITKDLSFVIDQTVLFSEISNTLFKNGSEYLNSIKLLDEYRGDSIPDHQTSLCIQLTFQSSQKTLITKEIDEILEHFKTVLETKLIVQPPNPPPIMRAPKTPGVF